MKTLVILGCGGHAKSIADVAILQGYTSIYFIDSNGREGEMCLGFPVFQSLECLPVKVSECVLFPGSGNNTTRFEQCSLIKRLGAELATIISPLAYVSESAVIQSGVFIGNYAHVGPLARVAMGCIINTSALVEHECCIGEFSHVSVNATIAGKVDLGSFVMLGAGATVIDTMAVTDNVVIGAGACVIRAIVESGTYIGVPAKRIK